VACRSGMSRSLMSLYGCGMNPWVTNRYAVHASLWNWILNSASLMPGKPECVQRGQKVEPVVVFFVTSNGVGYGVHFAGGGDEHSRNS